MNYKIGQLIVSPKQKSDTSSKIFISQPSAQEENLLGRLFVLVEFKNKQPEIAKLVSHIIEQAKKNYYHNEKILLLEKTASVKVIDIFESAIAKLNQSIVEFLQTGKIKFAANNLNITIGIIYQNELHFANLGRNKALLIYKPKNSLNEKEYNLMSVTKQTADPTQEIFNINKLFSNIINGSIPMGSYFVFTNEALSEYLSEKQLLKIITTLPPAGAVEQIRNILQQTNVYVPFLGLIIKNGQTKTPLAITSNPPIRATQTAGKILPKPTPVQSDRQTNSLEILSSTEEKTARIMNPAGFINFTKYKKLLNKLDLRKWKKAQNKNQLSFKGKLIISRSFFSKIKGKTLALSALITNGITFIFKTLTNKQKMGELKQNIITKKNRLNRKQIIILSIISLIFIAFVINLSYVKVKNQRLTAAKDYRDKITAIKNKQKKIATAELYDNVAEARTSLIAIAELLKDFPQTNEGQIRDYKKLLKEYNSKYDKLNNVTRLTAPTIIVNLADQTKPQNLTLVNGQLYLSDNYNKAIYAVDVNQPLPKIVIQGPDIKNLTQPAVNDNNDIYYLKNNNSLAIFDPSSQQLQILPTDILPANISAMTIFNNKIYIFAPQEKQIYRYNKYGNTLGNKKEWLKQNELQLVKNLSIDGFIYVLTDNNIYQYGGGRKQDFSLETINPKLENPSKLISLKNYDLLYVLEPTNNRLIVFNKNGKFLAQYTSDLFNNLIDFTVDEAGQSIYLLNDKTIYERSIWGTD